MLAAGKCVGLSLRQPRLDFLAGQMLESIEQQQAQCTLLPGRQPQVARLLESGPPFVVRHHHRMPPRPHGALRLVPDAIELTRVITAAFLGPASVQPARGLGRGGVTVVEEGK